MDKNKESFHSIISKALDKAIEKQEIKKFVDVLTNLLNKIDKEEDLCYLKEEMMEDLYEMVNGPHFDETTSLKVVSMMENVDGTEGPHWSLKDTTEVMNKYRYGDTEKYNKYDWYVIMNMMWSDYCEVLGNQLEIYAAMTNAYFNGPDEEVGKAWGNFGHKVFKKEEMALKEEVEEPIEKNYKHKN